ncbi:MAG: PhzF family phenazine biosynthesis protein [Bryobacteraceae bacterium]|nr:PhzF family phenazine biosynthesis protein [Bryobacteraceae bacterium]MDW8379324.1 PhzF family phenazine biosynthesis protein [Bryobacterales bacterium]
MRLPFYQVDAFTDRLFGGNPAAVCPLESWLPDAILQNIAAENNLAETAYFLSAGDAYQLRWFTPTVEVDLCGHATLASAFVLWRKLGEHRPQIDFDTRSGRISVRLKGDWMELDFPSRPPESCQPPAQLRKALGGAPEAVLAARDYLVVYGSEEEVRALKPDLEGLKQLDRFAVIVTAPGRECDFVSRFFAPAQGIDEDPATGSAHCTLTPYWSQRLAKKRMHAKQLSQRGGEMVVEDRGSRVGIAGQAVLYLEGFVEI